MRACKFKVLPNVHYSRLKLEPEDDFMEAKKIVAGILF
jgi:hypothetical protein